MIRLVDTLVMRWIVFGLFCFSRDVLTSRYGSRRFDCVLRDS